MNTLYILTRGGADDVTGASPGWGRGGIEIELSSVLEEAETGALKN